jgi:DNA-binding GntR family transcriptional regulator
MAKINLKKVIGNNSHWTLNKSIVRQIGLTETLVLQHIIDLESVFKRTEIFQPIPQMAEELGISEWALKQSIGKLKSADLITVQRKSVGFMNFYSVNEEKVLEFMSGSVNPPVSSNSTHQRVGHVSEVESNSQWDETQLTVSSNSTMSELEYNSLTGENHSAITNNTTNNTLPIIDTNNTTNDKSGNLKNITEKVIEILVDANSQLRIYNKAVEDYNELGGIDGIAEILEWDSSQKSNWLYQIKNINLIK